ncbi:histamine H2 receptor-like [Rhinatrema bivittatum]|uniref:histamine H2 receptor-like n=1 Tax=Rhinatrema bivittatum TaxID=194408 RepID=UPI00112B1B15|nr:histamine H2 receptor-like [Rhinatrema bivittatum]
MHADFLSYTTLTLTTCTASLSTNILLLILFASNPILQTETSALTLNLNICDMILPLTVIPVSIYNSLFNSTIFKEDTTVCHLAASLFVLLLLNSLHSLTWVTIDKFTKICFPLRYAQLLTRQRTWIILCLTWIYCTLYAAFLFLGFGDYAYNENINICLPTFSSSTKIYNVVLLSLGIILPLMIVCLFYIAIIYTARNQAMRGTFVCNDHHCYYVPIKSYFRSTIVLVLSAVYPLVCWIPYVTISFYETFHGKDVPSLVEKISVWLVLLTTGLNPWLNALIQKKYRKALRQSWKKFNQVCVCLKQNDQPLPKEQQASPNVQDFLPGSSIPTSVNT